MGWENEDRKCSGIFRDPEMEIIKSGERTSGFKLATN